MTSSAAERRYESMLFNYETTGRTDFRDGRIKPIITTEYKPKSTCLRVRPPPLKDIHALTDWRVPNVPFNLMHKPKDVVRTNPRVVQEPYVKTPLDTAKTYILCLLREWFYFQHEPEDEIREEVQRTRPRLVMTPAVSLDDIEPVTRKMLVEDIYVTSVMQMMRESGVSEGSSLRAPLPKLPAPANPITLPKLMPQYVSPEWRMDSAAWDNRQLRTYCDPTKEFWLAFQSKCDVCDETAEREAQRKMRRLAKRR
ncbi:uncharacterized protein LOC114356614 [Ostrinia furnacalis]|uniref:uncharacterized protein LOC114356614 n=1 Tax=Ostrinia furnacalis TaxID=93504 RepID=UPI00103D8610|nr:uncharacterized protein LOC114356614 [Ostrinia furnacalis]